MNPPIRVLYLNHVSQVSGAEKSLLELLTAVDRSRYEPILAISGAGPLSDLAAGAGLQVRWLPVKRLKRTRNPLRLLAYLLRLITAVRDLRRVIRRGGIRLVHCNSTTAQLFGGIAARLSGVPCVWHVRDLARIGRLEGMLTMCSCRILAISQAVGQTLTLDPRKVTVVHNGIDADAFAGGATAGRIRAELQLGPDAPLVAMVAQMVPWKGHGAFLDAMAGIVRELPAARALVVGADLFNDDPGYETALRDKCHELRLDDHVTFMGQRADVPDILADVDALVVPSTREPFGRVALEAMALGKPVVGFRSGGLPEVVEDGVTGLLVPLGDTDALAAAMARLFRDRELARRMGEAGARRVRAQFTAKQMAAKVEAVYAELLAGRARRGAS